MMLRSQEVAAVEVTEEHLGEARVQVDLENNSALLGKTPYVISASNDPVYFNTQLQILTSPGLLRRVVKTLDLEHNPDFFKGNSTQNRGAVAPGLIERHSRTSVRP